MATSGQIAKLLWLRWRIFLVNLGLRYVEWQIERKQWREIKSGGVTHDAR